MTMLLTGIAFLVGLVLIGFAVGYSLGDSAGYQRGFIDGLVGEEEEEAAA